MGYKSDCKIYRRPSNAPMPYIVRWIGAYGMPAEKPLEWELFGSKDEGRILAAESLLPDDKSYVPGWYGLRVSNPEQCVYRCYEHDAFTDHEGRADNKVAFGTYKDLPAIHARQRCKHKCWHTEVSLYAFAARYDALVIKEDAPMHWQSIKKAIRYARKHGLAIIRQKKGERELG